MMSFNLMMMTYITLRMYLFPIFMLLVRMLILAFGILNKFLRLILNMLIRFLKLWLLHIGVYYCNRIPHFSQFRIISLINSLWLIRWLHALVGISVGPVQTGSMSLSASGTPYLGLLHLFLFFGLIRSFTRLLFLFFFNFLFQLFNFRVRLNLCS